MTCMKNLTGKLVVHCPKYIVNAFYLVVVGWTVPIIKVNLPSPKNDSKVGQFQINPHLLNAKYLHLQVMAQVNERDAT